MRLFMCPGLLAAFSFALASPSRAQTVLLTLHGQPGDCLGAALRGAGDVDGDGVPDIIAGAPCFGFSNPPIAHVGRAYVFSGADGSVLHVFTASQSFVGTDGGFGRSVAGVGDVDGDGRADVAIGTPNANANGTDSGNVKVFSGGSGSELFSWDGPAWTRFGYSVAGAGDVDGDGRPDVAVGSYPNIAGPPSPGSVWVLSGLDGSLIRQSDGLHAYDNFGYSVDAAGDLDLDGRAEILVGATGVDLSSSASNNGAAYVISGATGATLFALSAVQLGGQLFGETVRNVGDVDGDGRPDIASGSYTGDGMRVFSGADGTPIRTVDGLCSDEFFGGRLGPAGDVDGDGFADFLGVATNAEFFGQNSGAAYLYSGRDGSIATILSGTVANQNYVRAVDRIGDLDGDGFDEYAIGGTSGAGQVVVYAGRAGAQMGLAYGFGDGSSGPCPCGNVVPTGTQSGCRNSLGTGGLLIAGGSRSAGDDTLFLTMGGVPHNVTTVLFAGTSQVGGVAVGAGLRCVGGTLQRLGLANTGTCYPRFGPGLRAIGGWNAGDTRFFQAWYRDPDGPCGATFNLTSALRVSFEP